MRDLPSRIRFHLTMTVAAMLLPATLSGQSRPLNDAAVAMLLRQLQSTQWHERADAFERLRSDSRALNRSDVHGALLDLLEAELSKYQMAFRASPERAATTYGEEYAEYVAWVGDVVDGFADWNDPHQACVLIHQAYDSDGAYATKVASHPKTAIPCLIAMFGSDLPGLRAKPAPIFVQILATPDPGLGAKTTLEMQQIIRRALQDPDDAVRIDAIVALDRFGGEDMIPALKEVTNADPAPEVQGHSIRKLAAAAIRSIQNRAAEKKPYEHSRG